MDKFRLNHYCNSDEYITRKQAAKLYNIFLSYLQRRLNYARLQVIVDETRF